MSSIRIQSLARRARSLLPATFLLAGLGWVPIELAGQSILRGEIQGVVRDEFGEGIPSAAVTLTEVGSGISYLAETNRQGAFLVSMIEAGDYEILAEARGFIPRVVQGLRVRAGQMAGLSLTLVATVLPPERVDTVQADLSAAPRTDAEGSRWFGGSEISALADPRMGLGRLSSLAPHLDESLGSEGLPGMFAKVIIDGLPFTAARHPLQTGGDLLPLLPRAAIATLDIHRRADVEWSGAAGSYLSVTSRPAGARYAAEGFVAGSAAALWQSEALDGAEKPGATSLWGGGSVHLPIESGRTSLFLSAEGGQLATPYPSPVSDAFAARLAGGPLPAGVSEAAELTEPWTSELRSFSGLGRLDWNSGESTEVVIRGAFGTVQESGSPNFGIPFGYGSTPAYDGTDLLLGASLLAQAHPLVNVELRAGVERSTRTWSGPEGGSESSPLVSTRFVDEDILLGSPQGLAGAVSRTGVVATGTGHYNDGPHSLKGGLSGTFASHEFQYQEDSAGAYLFSDPEGLAAGIGILRQSATPVPTRSFSVPELGIFGQYRWEPTLGIRLTAALRYDREILPRSSLPPNLLLDSLVGAPTSIIPASLQKFSPRITASWDLSGDGRSVIEGSMGAQYDRLDPAALHEAIAHSGISAHREVVGALDTEWPAIGSGAASSPGYGSTFALFGPELQAPRTARATLGLSQRLGAATVIHLSGVFRRTEFLLRREDLNLALAPSGSLPDGRPTYGTLTQIGAIVAPLPDSNRRFTDFGKVWALNPDGISEHRGMTVTVEHAATSRLDLLASYTYSTTEDNLFGAGDGMADSRSVPILPVAELEWEAGRSDFDLPHRFVAVLQTRFDFLEGVRLSGAYRFASGRPFTAGYRDGVDINGDGSGHNDPAAVPLNLGTLAADLVSCLSEDLGGIATRNGCRGPSTHRFDLRVSAGIFRWGGSVGSLTIDLFNILDQDFGVPDSALLLIDPSGTLQTDSQTGVTTVPISLNPNFGTVTRSASPGRLIRVGFSVGMP